MKDLTTRKIVLGLLMTCVLAFGVQGVAKAINNPNTNGIATETTVSGTVFNVGASSSITSITTTFDKIGTKETVSISKTSGVTLTGDFYGLSRVTLTEDENTTDGTEANGDGFTYTRDGRTQTLSGQATGDIGITFTTKGIQSVTISSRDYDGDTGNPAGAWSRKYTYYVKGPGASTTTISLLGLRNGYKTGIFAGDTHRERIHTGDSGHYAVTYTTIPTGAMAQIEDTAGALGGLTALNNNDTSSAFDVLLRANETYQVTAKVDDSDRETIGVYIIGTPTLAVGHPGNPNGDDALTDAVEGNKRDPGQINDTLPAEGSPTNRAFTAIVRDGTDTAVPGVVVTFRAGGSGTGGGRLVFNSTNNAGTLVDSSNRSRLDANRNQLTTDTNTILYVRTNASGQADVDFQLGTDRKQDVTISAVGQSKVVSAYAGAVSGDQLVNPKSKSSQVSGRSGEYELRVEVENADGEELSDQWVQFRTSDGTLDDPSDTLAPTTIGHLAVQTDTQGIAFVFFDPGETSGSLRVTAHLLDIGSDDTANTGDDTVIDDVVFNIRGGSPPPIIVDDEEEEEEEEDEEEEEEAQPLQQRQLSIGVTGTGATRSITVTATDGGRNIPGVTVTLRGSALTQGQRTVTVGTPITITLPTAPGDYRLEASASGFTTSPIETITVTGGSTPGTTPGAGTLTVEKDGAQTGTQQPIRVRATPAPSRNLRFTVTRGDASVGVGLILTTGTGTAIVTVPATVLYVLTVSAEGYTPKQVTFIAGTETPTVSDTPPSTSTAGDPSRIEIDGASTRSGTEDTELEDPLRVRVLDDDDDPVRDARVIFRVRTGQGRLSQRGNGRATSANTNSRGYADVNYTPLSASSTVSASVNGVPLAVTFTITTGSALAGQSKTYKTGDKIPISLDGTLTFSGSRTLNGTVYRCVGSGECVVSYGTLVKGEIQAAAVVRVQAKAYKTGDKIPISLEDTLTFSGSRTLNGTVYRCVGSGECVVSYGTLVKGEIQVSTVTTPGTGERPRPIEINPMVRVNAANRPPMLWVDGGAIYALVGASVQKFAPGVDNALNIAVGGGKVYWTEKTGESGGTINSANLNGTGVTELASIFATR